MPLSKILQQFPSASLPWPTGCCTVCTSYPHPCAHSLAHLHAQHEHSYVHTPSLLSNLSSYHCLILPCYSWTTLTFLLPHFLLPGLPRSQHHHPTCLSFSFSTRFLHSFCYHLKLLFLLVVVFLPLIPFSPSLTPQEKKPGLSYQPCCLELVRAWHTAEAHDTQRIYGKICQIFFLKSIEWSLYLSTALI